MKTNLTLVLVAVLLLASGFSFGQTNAWNANTFKLSSDVASLEDMTGATTVTFPTTGTRSTDTIPFPAGFRFRFGLDTFSRYALNNYGWLRLGTTITSSFYSSQENIIVPFSNQASALACSYKLVGSAPYRRFIVEWSGFFLGPNQQVKFQLWLHETNGRIAVVHQGMSASSGSVSYYIFCRATISGQRSLASADVRVPPQTPLANYTSEVGNNEIIPANTRYTFQPDTTKPIRPGVNFSNIQPGCFTVNIKDSSATESIFVLEKKLNNGSYTLSRRAFSTTVATTGTLYPFSETTGKPDSLFTYRAFATNGFINSDTTVTTLLTPSPLINGTKTIPGDYASINALLQDAACKHIGPNLVIELQPSYSFAAEGGVVRFRPLLAHGSLQSITIRPAAAATALLLNNTAAYPLIMVDSVPNVWIDGRASGSGSTNHLTMRQGDQYQPAIAFVNNASGGGVRYANIEGNSKSITDGLLYLGNRDPLNFGVNYFNGANNITIANCKIGPTSGFTYRGVAIESGHSNTIRENEFFRFFKDAISYTEGGSNSRIIKNRLYQPEPMPAQDGFSSSSSQGAIVLTNMQTNIVVDSNRLGGSAAIWGSGSWQQNIAASSNGYALIRLTLEPEATAFIRHNELANLNTTSNNFLHAILAKGGRHWIEGNKIGTADSLGSIASAYHIVCIYPYQAKQVTLRNNFIGGITGNGDGLLLRVSSVDSVFIMGNNVGGRAAYQANRFSNYASGIETSGLKYLVIKNNEVQGLTSDNLSALGITHEWNAVTGLTTYAIVDSNQVHHLDARRMLLGIFMRVNTERDNSVSYNRVYALRGRGPSTFTGADNPTAITGVSVSARESTFNVPSKDTGIVYMQNNLVHSLAYNTPSRSYNYPVTGLSAEGLRFRIHNNMISLGINAAGMPSDSIEMACTGIDVYSAIKAEVEHNSIYIGGASQDINYGIKLKDVNYYTNGQKDYFVTNNLIQIDRRPTSISDVKYYISAINNASKNIVANKNSWYSNNDPNLATKRQQWINNCQCDSLNLVANPLYANPAGDSSNINLHLLPNNPTDSAGIPSVAPIAIDFDSELRQQHSPVDIGADAVTPCTTGNSSISLSPYQDKIEICAGTTLTLNATVTGSVTNWQWQKNLNNIPSATGPSYTVTTSGSYRLVGRTACGWIASPSVNITTGITAPYKKLVAVTPAPYCDSSNVLMKIEHNHWSLTTLQYKWYRNNVLIPGITTDTATIRGIRYGDNISVQVTNPTPCGNTTVTDNLGFFNVNPSERPKINILSLRDTLYSLNSNDTVKYNINLFGFGLPTVIYTSPVPGPMHSFVGDSLVVFSNVPYTFSFRLSIGNPALLCQFPDTTVVKTIFVSNSAVPKTYIFNGVGNWSDPANWSNGEIPPSPLPFNGTILINSGVCTLNVPFTVGIGGQLTVATGATLIVQGNLTRL
jgi:hypothetical protein